MILCVEQSNSYRMIHAKRYPGSLDVIYRSRAATPTISRGQARGSPDSLEFPPLVSLAVGVAASIVLVTGRVVSVALIAAHVVAVSHARQWLGLAVGSRRYIKDDGKLVGTIMP
ncbi:hypothetical protein BDW02DRAFT_80945 [Decorospora gaudefroyi]|uniref:Uncharacterized protein n=1 Tax=Decorospora gaudefroyi TaxID=184978 RepID=A0A6A5K1H1_9PLEO|nr:hypothetical protein BDW02DRAFT_80945 [Decorospora gaudefroyi]